jgi:hypothetical protein
MTSGGTGEGNYEFGLQSIFVYTLKSSLTCRKILRHGADSISTSPSKEVVLLCFIALKRRFSSAGFIPAKFGSTGKLT